MRNLGTVTVGKSGKVMTFRVKNVGKRNLKNLKLLVRGKHAEDFQVVKTLTRKTLKPGVILTFKIAFKPTEDGLRKADLRIKSNDADENPFNVKLSGTGRLPASEGIKGEHTRPRVWFSAPPLKTCACHERPAFP